MACQCQCAKTTENRGSFKTQHIRKKVSLNIISDKQVEFGTIQKMWYISSRDMCANANNIFSGSKLECHQGIDGAYAILMY
jgi:hypothetical protein